MSFPFLVGWFVCAAAISVGLFVAGAGVRGVLKANAARSWATTEGTIESCDLEYLPDNEGGQTFRVKVAYVYKVGEKEYQGNRIAYGYDSSPDLDFHKTLVSRLTDARTVLVRYSPRTPAEAVLAFSADRASQLMIVFGAVFFLAALGLGFMYYETNRGDPDVLKTLIVVDENKTAADAADSVAGPGE